MTREKKKKKRVALHWNAFARAISWVKAFEENLPFFFSSISLQIARAVVLFARTHRGSMSIEAATEDDRAKFQTSMRSLCSLLFISSLYRVVCWKA